jgi:hypothetical protein
MFEMFMGLDQLIGDSSISLEATANSCDTLITLLIKMYKVMIKVTKFLIERKSKTFSNEFARLILILTSAEKFSSKLEKLIEKSN